MKMHVINATDFIWAESEESARNHFVNEVPDEEIISMAVMSDDTPVYIQEPAEGGESLWWFKKHPGWNVLEESTLGEFFKSYCKGVSLPFIVYSTNW
ncbi:hypothetical protein ACHHV8_36535 [Paenibacillus sp. TAB 01]|uniref:hypothetical protein n=1 Tax=Paenibacillus sp. TAB 01 TaxID=3368988 RepID=UPI003750D6C7